MSCNRLRFLLIALPLALLTACHRGPARSSVQRIAILRFENLGTDPADDWMGRAFSEVIGTELEGAPGLTTISAGRLHATSDGLRPAGAPGISAERTAALAAGATRIGYGQYLLRNGTIRARLTLEDPVTGQMTSLNPVSAPAAEVIKAATALASQISPRLTEYGTRSAPAVKAHVEALEDLAAAGTGEELEKAIAADPDYGPPYRLLAQLKARQKDVPGALVLLHQALVRGSVMGAAEHARIQLQDAILRGDAPARLQALAELAKAEPRDPETWHDLGTASTASHQYQQAVEAFRHELAIQPEDADSWNLLGYAAAYAGDAATANSAITTYQKLAPASPNPLDSLGDVNLILGRLSEAEGFYLQGAKKDPSFFAGLDFLKAAMAHLMTGDIPGAGAVAQQYFNALIAAKDPLVEYRKAQWSWITGRRKVACQQMEKVAHDFETAGARDFASHAYTELGMWTLMLGNREVAAQLAQKAVALASPSSASPAILARFLTQPTASPAEWEARINQLAPNPAQASLRNFSLVYALVIAREYSAAAAVLHPIYEGGTAAAEEVFPVLLAWADLETGNVQEAAALLQPNAPLTNVGLTWSTPFRFPRIYYLRGLVAQKQGKFDEAKENFRLFTTLSGPDPLMWGEEQKAK